MPKETDQDRNIRDLYVMFVIECLMQLVPGLKEMMRVKQEDFLNELKKTVDATGKQDSGGVPNAASGNTTAAGNPTIGGDQRPDEPASLDTNGNLV